MALIVCHFLKISLILLQICLYNPITQSSCYSTLIDDPIVHQHLNFNNHSCPGQVGQLVGTSSLHDQKIRNSVLSQGTYLGCWFNSQPRSRSMWEGTINFLSHINVSSHLSFPLPLTINEHVLEWQLKNKSFLHRNIIAMLIYDQRKPPYSMNKV